MFYWSLPYCLSARAVRCLGNYADNPSGEFISANSGLGYLVYSASNELNTAVSMAALLVLVLVVAFGDMLLDCGRCLGA